MNAMVILSYGVFEPTNLQYQKYLDSSIEIIHQIGPDVVITVGGPTNNLLPQVSESQSVASYLRPFVKNSKILLEDKSFTTSQNLQFSKIILENESADLASINIVCDSIRSIKVFYLAIQLYYPYLSEEKILEIILDYYTAIPVDLLSNHQLHYQKITVYGVNLHRSLEETSQQIISTILESNYLKYPKLHQKYVDWRKQKWGISC